MPGFDEFDRPEIDAMMDPAGMQLDDILQEKPDAVLMVIGSQSDPIPRESNIDRLIRWRRDNPTEFKKRRIGGMKKSSKVSENLRRLHREKKEEWRASARKNPKLCATAEHIAARDWSLKGPNGTIYQFRNLKQWLRDNPELFDPSDVTWQESPKKNNQSWCIAYQSLAKLRPGRKSRLSDWNGWEWYVDPSSK